MNETLAYEYLRPRLQALGLDPQRIENVLAKGTPDVNYTLGWIETKYLEAWPKRPDTVVHVHTLEDRKEQVVFLLRRWINRGPAWLMLRVARQYMLFAAPDVRAVRLGLARDELLQLACWKTGPTGIGDYDELGCWLRWQDEALPLPARARLLRLRCRRTVEQAAELLSIRPWQVTRAETEECEATNDLLDAWLA